jgi:hypothetical protein
MIYSNLWKVKYPLNCKLLSKKKRLVFSFSTLSHLNFHLLKKFYPLFNRAWIALSNDTKFVSNGFFLAELWLVKIADAETADAETSPTDYLKTKKNTFPLGNKGAIQFVQIDAFFTSIVLKLNGGKSQFTVMDPLFGEHHCRFPVFTEWMNYSHRRPKPFHFLPVAIKWLKNGGRGLLFGPKSEVTFFVLPNTAEWPPIFILLQFGSKCFCPHPFLLWVVAPGYATKICRRLK